MTIETQFKTKELRYKIARHLAQILRIELPKLKIEKDSHGYASVEDLLEILKKKFDFITLEHLDEIVLKDAQHRFEKLHNKIRAKAGHTFEVELPNKPITPPLYLYHGTSPEVVKNIIEEGIKKGEKSFVHLANTIQRAFVIGKRKSKNPTILTIRAKDAHNNGIRFWKSGQVSDDGEIWLSDEIPIEFLK